MYKILKLGTTLCREGQGRREQKRERREGMGERESVCVREIERVRERKRE